VGLKQGPLSLVSTTEELLERKRSGFGLENREYGSRDASRRPRGTLYPQKLALTSPTNGGRSVSVVRSWTQATEFSLVFVVDRIDMGMAIRTSVTQRSRLRTATNIVLLHFTHFYSDAAGDVAETSTAGALHACGETTIVPLCAAIVPYSPC
jgi:hypothetical protein